MDEYDAVEAMDVSVYNAERRFVMSGYARTRTGRR